MEPGGRVMPAAGSPTLFMSECRGSGMFTFSAFENPSQLREKSLNPALLACCFGALFSVE